MCSFPHNPAILCVLGSVEGKSVKGGKGSPKTSCLLQLKANKVIRPAGVYAFNDSLDKVKYSKRAPWQQKKWNKTHKVYATSALCKSLTLDKQQVFRVRMSCSDDYPGVKDYSWVLQKDISGPVLDPWEQKSFAIDCGFLKSK
jgi:hypothetical protein